MSYVTILRRLLFSGMIFLYLSGAVLAQSGDDYLRNSDSLHKPIPIRTETQFNGYTNFWHDDYKEWYRYGGLFKMSIANPEYTIEQSKVDVAEDMGLPGFSMQEGFLSGLLSTNYSVLSYPAPAAIAREAGNGNLLITATDQSETGQLLTKGMFPGATWGDRILSHQYRSPALERSFAFVVEKNGHKIFVLLSRDTATLSYILDLVNSTKKILAAYDLKKGWFGAETLLKSVTIMQGHPIEVIGKGMNEGNSWFVFNGYMEFLAQKELKEWIGKVDLPVVADVGTLPVFGCADYDGLQVQDMQTKQSWIDFAHQKKGYIFRPVYDPESDPYHYDGYIAGEGNKEQADNDDVPFVTTTGGMPDDLLTSMVLFHPKGQPFTREAMWESILKRREVAILPLGKMMGPALYRHALELLFLDKVFLEEYFGDRVDVETEVKDYTLSVKITNNNSRDLKGTLDIHFPGEIKPDGAWDASLSIGPGETKTVKVNLRPQAEAMSKTNPIAVYVSWPDHKKGTVAMLDLPPAISVHRLLYAVAPKISYPVTIHNFTGNASFPVKVEVLQKNNPANVVFTATRNCTAATAHFQVLPFDLQAPPGSYIVKVSALGLSYNSQLGVGKPEGKCYAYPVDLNSDGVMEYRLENDSVEITLLATGARVIEYIVKSRKDNVLFKLWPEKADDDRRAFRKRGYYPYGGFEDFLGQGSMETHRVYDAAIIKKEGDYVQVKMTTDYFGNKLEKTFTLFGNSPLLEIRFALTFINPEANVIGPQPILELGKAHGPEDVFMVPSKEGLQEWRMRPEMYYGHIFRLQEGWNAGYDTKEDISYAEPIPSTSPFFLHMWMNHPRNGDAHHYYTEFQPWTPIIQKSTMYFSYYMWGAGGPWQDAVKALRDRN